MKQIKRTTTIIVVIITLIGFASVATALADNQIIYKAQKSLKVYGYYPDPLDGMWSIVTESAVREFQGDNGLSVTGKLDKRTKEKLGLNLVNVTTEDVNEWEIKRNIKHLISALAGTYRLTAQSANWGLVSKAAAEALGRIGDKRAIEPLGVVLRYRLMSNESPAKYATAKALGKFGNLGVEYLIAALKDKDSWVESRAAAARVLGEIAAKHAVKPLITVLMEDPQKDGINLYSRAAWALGSIGDKRAIEPLNSKLSSVDEHSYIAESVIEALDRLDALKMDVQVAYKGYEYFIAKGEGEKYLVEAFNKYVTVKMAVTYLNSDNDKLEQLAKEWLRNHEYQIRTGRSWNTPITWGSRR